MARDIGPTPGGVSPLADHHAPALDRVPERHRGGPEFEVRVLTIPASTSTGDVRRLLTDEAEHGRWELARSLVYVGGVRRVWLRRPIIRVRSTLRP
jgi:hypothetical protein